MNTGSDQAVNGESVATKRRVIHKAQKKHLSGHAVLWGRAEQRAAELGYTGGLSGYVMGLILFDLLANRKHWLTVEVINDPEQLESVIFGLANQPAENWGAWIEKRLDEIAALRANAPPPGEVGAG